MVDNLVLIKDWITQLTMTLETIVKTLILSKRVQISKSINNSRLHILCNGPSLKEEMSSIIHTEQDVMAVNYFAQHPLFQKLKPKYYILQAPEFWIKGIDEIYYKNRNELFDILKDRTNWEMIIFMPSSAKRFQPSYTPLLDHPYITIQYFNDTPIEGFRIFRYWCYDKMVGIPRPHNVLIPSIMIGLYMKYKRIYLFGVDHSWLEGISVDDQNNALLFQEHFYDEKVQKETMKNKGKGQRKLHEILHKFYLSFKGYFEILDYSKSKNIPIYNCTSKSYIDAFERLDITQLEK